MKYYFKVFYKCIVDIQVYNSLDFDEIYNNYNECLKAARNCEDPEHYTIICTL